MGNYFDIYILIHRCMNFFVSSMHTDSGLSSLAQWIHLLSISTAFDIPRVRKRAIHELTTNYTIDPVQKIVLADKFGIDEWKKLSYEELVQRELKIQDDEAEILGAKTTARINRAREEILEEEAKKSTSLSRTCGNCGISSMEPNESKPCGCYRGSTCCYDYRNEATPVPPLPNDPPRFSPARVSHFVYEEFWGKDERKAAEEKRRVQELAEEWRQSLEKAKEKRTAEEDRLALVGYS
jgi:hypothetical protein